MAKELHCVQCNKFMGTIRDGNISKGLQPVCTKCFNLLMVAAGSWAQHKHKKGKEKKEYDTFSDLFGGSGGSSDDLFDGLFGGKK